MGDRLAGLTMSESTLRGGWGGSCDRELVRLTAQRFTCAARARVPKPTRRTACTHVSRAMQAARRRSVFDFTSRLGRRTEARPRQVLARVRRRPAPPNLHAAAVRIRWRKRLKGVLVQDETTLSDHYSHRPCSKPSTSALSARLGQTSFEAGAPMNRAARCPCVA